MHKLFRLVELESATDNLSDELHENAKTVKNDWLISKREIEDFLTDDIMSS